MNPRESQLPFRFHLSLSFSHSSISPSEITEQLELEPHQTKSKDQVSESVEPFNGVIAGTNHYSGFHNRHRWFHMFEPVPLTEPLDDCVRRLIKVLAPKQDFIRQFVASDGLASLSLVLYPPSHPEPMDWQLLAALRQLGLIVYFEISNRHEVTRPMMARQETSANDATH